MCLLFALRKRTQCFNCDPPGIRHTHTHTHRQGLYMQNTCSRRKKEYLRAMRPSLLQDTRLDMREVGFLKKRTNCPVLTKHVDWVFEVTTTWKKSEFVKRLLSYSHLEAVGLTVRHWAHRKIWRGIFSGQGLPPPPPPPQLLTPPPPARRDRSTHAAALDQIVKIGSRLAVILGCGWLRACSAQGWAEIKKKPYLPHV